MLKSNRMNSADFLGLIKISPFTSFLSITSGVLFVSSITTLNSEIPALAKIPVNTGLTIFLNLDHRASSLCSNSKYFVEDATVFLILIHRRLTLILSRAEALTCNVFCPQATTPVSGNVAIGLIRDS